MSQIRPRPEVQQKCYVSGCENLVWSSVPRKRCHYCFFARRTSDSPPKRKYARRNGMELDMDSPEACAEVERVYQDALAEIKRRPSGSVEVRWSSPLARL